MKIFPHRYAQEDEVDEDLISSLRETLREEQERLEKEEQNLKIKYDDKGNMIWQRFPNRVEIRYDESGNVIWEKQGNGREFGYNSGKLIWEKDPTGGKFEYRYDDKGRVSWYKIPDGKEYEYSYDNEGRISVKRTV